MKLLLSILLLSPLIAFTNDKGDFYVEHKNGYWCITHLVEKGETLSSLSKIYSVNQSVLTHVNNLTSESNLKLNQPIIVPLLETNFYKMSGISIGQTGFHPLYYTASNKEDVNIICKKFSLLQTSFMKWNHLHNESDLKENEKVIIGWLKCSKELYQTPSTTIKTEKKIATQTAVVTKSNSNESKKIIPNKETPPLPEVKLVSKPKPKQEYAKLEQPIQVTTEPSYIYHENEKKGGGGKLSGFFKKIKHSFTPKEKNDVEKEKPVIAKTEKKIIADKPIKYKEKKVIVKEENYIAKTQKEKKSLRQIWSQLVNGKEPIASTESATIVVRNTEVNQSAVPKNNVLYEKNKIAVAKKAPPVTKQTSNEVAKKTKPVTSNTKLPKVVKQETTSNKKEVILKEVKKKEKEKEKEREKENKLVLHSKAEEKAIEPLVVEDKLPEKEIVDPTIRSEIKTLSLSKSKVGKCSYFFSGPGAGQFYVFTNLAEKGAIIKITNSQNGRSVMAEVIGALPNADLSKGILIKLSDNAKLPLSQKHNLFNVKVNY